MLRRLTPAAVALCALLLAPVRPALAQDASSPKAAATTFFKAMETGDTKTAKSMAAGNDKQLAMLDMLVPVVSGFKQLESAAAKKWGEEGRKAMTQGQGGPSGFDYEKELKDAKEDVKGDTATLTPAGANPQQQKQPMLLKKVDGKWKVDMSNVPAEQADNPQAGRVLRAMADAAKSTASEIDQGKYANAQEAKEAMNQKIRPVIMEGVQQQGPGGAPGSAPGGQPKQPAQPEQPKQDKK